MRSSNYVHGMQMKISGCLEFPFFGIFSFEHTACAVDSAGYVIAEYL